MSTVDKSQNRTTRWARLAAASTGAAVPAVPVEKPRPSRDQFIPLRKTELVDRLANSCELSSSESADWRRFCRLVEGLVHREFQTSLEELKDAYAPFDPDADTRAGSPLVESELERSRETLFRQFGWLLERGNFTRLKQEEIDEAMSDKSHWGLNLAVDFDAFQQLELYYRGDTTVPRVRRSLATGFRGETVDVPIYQRLAVIFRLRGDMTISKYLDTHDVYLKLFKDIPKLDLEMLLPGTHVKMSLFDRARILLPTLSGASLAIWKIVAVVTAPLSSSLALLGVVGGTLGYGVRSLYGYLNTKQKYQLNLTQSLYYQNLDNNAGVLHRLLDEAEEQENREALLGYFFLWRHAPADGWTEAELDERIEAFLRPLAGRDVDFEVTDALAKLERLGVVETRPGEKVLAAPIAAALETLSRRWTVLPD